jgi:hypothetical protein
VQQARDLERIPWWKFGNLLGLAATGPWTSPTPCWCTNCGMRTKAVPAIWSLCCASVATVSCWFAKDRNIRLPARGSAVRKRVCLFPCPCPLWVHRFFPESSTSCPLALRAFLLHSIAALLWGFPPWICLVFRTAVPFKSMLCLAYALHV